MFDFSVYIDQAIDEFIEVETGVIEHSYTFTGLTSGLTYKFKLKARNQYGFSDFSNILSLYCAFKPDAPGVPVTETIGDNVKVSWS